MKYFIFHVFRTNSVPSKEKSSDCFENLHKLKIMTNFLCQSDYISRKSHGHCVQLFIFITLLEDKIRLMPKFARADKSHKFSVPCFSVKVKFTNQ